MSTTIEELEGRVRAMEGELRALKQQVVGPVSGCTPMNGSILEWYAEIRRQNAERGTIEERRRRLGIPVHMPRVGAKALRERMLAEGVRTEERLLSSEIVRLREE